MIFMVKYEEFALDLTTKISQNLKLRGNTFHKSVKRANVLLVLISTIHQHDVPIQYTIETMNDWIIIFMNDFMNERINDFISTQSFKKVLILKIEKKLKNS